jgi:hypothetical protein
VDITDGQEGIPIPATNLVDDPPVAPTGKLNYNFDTFMMGSNLMKFFVNVCLPCCVSGT